LNQLSFQIHLISITGQSTLPSLLNIITRFWKETCYPLWRKIFNGAIVSHL